MSLSEQSAKARQFDSRELHPSNVDPSLERAEHSVEARQFDSRELHHSKEDPSCSNIELADSAHLHNVPAFTDIGAKLADEIDCDVKKLKETSSIFK